MSFLSKISKKAFLAVGVFGVVLSASMAQAQVKSEHKDWQVACIDNAEPGRIRCVMSQVVDPKAMGKQPLVLIVKKQTDITPTITFNFLQALNEDAGMKIRIDQQKPYELQIDKCLEKGCLATANLKGDILSQMKKGEMAYLIYTVKTATGDKKVGAKISLMGFTASLKELLKKS